MKNALDLKTREEKKTVEQKTNVQVKIDEKRKTNSASRAQVTAAKQQRERYTPTNLRRRKKKKLSGKELSILLIPALAAAVAVAIAAATFNHGSTYTFEKEAVQYYGGSSAPVAAGTQLTVSGEGQSSLPQSEEGTNLPIYLKDSPAIVLPSDMIYYTPRDGGYGRISCFSELECKSNGMITVKRDGKSIQPSKGFLYDGEDFYVFLEPMTIAFNGYTMDVPALSYVEAIYGGHMMIFNYETKEFTIEQCDGSGTASSNAGDYTISLLGDSMTLYDGTKYLLVTRPDLFDPIV